MQAPIAHTVDQKIDLLSRVFNHLFEKPRPHATHDAIMSAFGRWFWFGESLEPLESLWPTWREDISSK